MAHKSNLLRSVHEAAADLHSIGALSDKKMQHFDLACLTEAPPITTACDAQREGRTTALRYQDALRGAIVGAPADPEAFA